MRDFCRDHDDWRIARRYAWSRTSIFCSEIVLIEHDEIGWPLQEILARHGPCIFVTGVRRTLYINTTWIICLVVKDMRCLCALRSVSSTAALSEFGNDVQIIQGRPPILSLFCHIPLALSILDCRRTALSFSQSVPYCCNQGLISYVNLIMPIGPSLHSQL